MDQQRYKNMEKDELIEIINYQNSELLEMKRSIDRAQADAAMYAKHVEMLENSISVLMGNLPQQTIRKGGDK